MEEKILIANVIRNFTIKSLDERDKMIIAGEMVLRSRNGMRLRLTPRFTKKDTYRNLIVCDEGSKSSGI